MSEIINNSLPKTCTARTGTSPDSSTLNIEKIKASSKRVLSLLPIAAIAAASLTTNNGCGGEAFAQDDNYNDTTDAGTDAPFDSEQDVLEDITPDKEQDATKDVLPEADTNTDGGCQGNKITITVPGYELFHAGLNCNPVYLDTTADNNTLETENRTICVMPHDRLVVVTYYSQINDLKGNSTIDFTPLVIRGGINMENTTPDSYFLLTQCLQKIEHGGACIPINVNDADPSEHKFVYPGEPNCTGTTNPEKTANLFYLAN